MTAVRTWFSADALQSFGIHNASMDSWHRPRMRHGFRRSEPLGKPKKDNKFNMLNGHSPTMARKCRKTRYMGETRCFRGSRISCLSTRSASR
ncbi:MAG: hypothetical protein BWY17_03888 [Deltaproteobacteria bacterium ADurb.Bin207]|jgi:hypothetical protein|nr:MAG: hypothetical protein BWY17_03888 [Deltaproteobacteria bacterium ADurb.Bin207]